MHYTQQNTDIPLLYYKKADNFKDWFCKNGEVKDDFKLHQSDHKEHFGIHHRGFI